MKILAMKNDPGRTFQEMSDIQFLMRLPGTDREEIRDYFEKRNDLAEHHSPFSPGFSGSQQRF